MHSILLHNYHIAKDYQINTIPNTQTIINTINAHSWVTADSDELFKEALQSSDILLPDGIGIVLAARFIQGIQLNKVAGADLHKMILETANRTAGRCFYLGSSQYTLNRIKKRLQIEYPNIKIETYSPPYKPEFSEEDNQSMIQAINQFEPNILFVGMTAPKQEKWILKNKTQIKANVITGIGAVFDFYAGTKKRPARWMINCGLEWLGRLIQDPKRLWKRYLINNQIFIYKIIKIKMSYIFR